MKDKLKNTLEHEVELLGRSISVLAIAGLLLIGGGSAALLTSFGTVSGTADVDQAIQIGSGTVEDGTAYVGLFGTSDDQSIDSSTVTAGSTTVETFKIKNNMDESYSLTYSSSLDRDSTDVQSEKAGTEVDWTNGDDKDVGITTRFVHSYADAGESGYSAPSPDDGADFVIDSQSDLENFIAGSDASGEDTTEDDYTEVSDGDYVEVESVDSGYTLDESDASSDDPGVLTIEKEITFYAASDGVTLDVDVSDSTNAVSLAASGATFTGFDVDYSTDGDSQWENAIEVSQPDVEVSYNDVDVDRPDSDQTTSGILVVDDGIGFDEDTGANVSYNSVNGAYVGALVSDATVGNHGYEGDTSLKSNNVEGDYGVVVSAHSGQQPLGTELSRNSLDAEVEDIYVPDDEAFAGTSVPEITGTSNEVDVSDNFFSNGLPDFNHVDASYEEAGSVAAEETLNVAAVNEFDIMMDGTDEFTLETEIS